MRKLKNSLFHAIWVIVVLAVSGYAIHTFVSPNVLFLNKVSTKINQLLPDTDIVAKGDTVAKQEPFAYTNKRKMVMANVDSLGRAVNSHIQLKASERPMEKREPRLTYNPPGWHNYRFSFVKDGKEKKEWVMNRGHLVGYQFCGLNDEARNLTPETAYLNTGALSGTDSANKQCMLFYEKKLTEWMFNHKSWRLDYQVTPLYKGKELIPRQVRLAYVGYDDKGKKVSIRLFSAKECKGNGDATVVVLDNVQSNVNLNYLTGTAKQK